MITDMADISQIIVADAASLDEYAFGITVIFERILERRIPMMDIRKWTYAAACDGNFRSTSGCILALLLSDRGYIPRVLNMNMGDSDSPEYSRESLSFQLCVQQYCQNNCDSYYDVLCDIVERYRSVETMVCLPPGDSCEDTAYFLHRAPQIRSTLLSSSPVNTGGVNWQNVSSSICYALGITDKDMQSLKYKYNE